jgi:hypothetical protein
VPLNRYNRGASVTSHEQLHLGLEAPWERFERACLGEEPAAELGTVSGLWFRCGYRPGIAAYLNFFLLRDFITLHDRAFPARFASFRSMADSFYRTDLFVRDVTDSGARPTGGISSSKVRALLRAILARHRKLSIPGWMMTYFGFSLVEAVERECAPLAADEGRLHLAYMARAFRLMGLRFSERREPMDAFAREVERVHAAPSPQLDRHARRILVLGEMVGVSSGRVGRMLPAATRGVFEPVAARVRPGLLRRGLARGLGRLLMRRALGAPRRAQPVEDDAP